MQVKKIENYFYKKGCEVIPENELNDYGFLEAVNRKQYHHNSLSILTWGVARNKLAIVVSFAYNLTLIT